MDTRDINRRAAGLSPEKRALLDRRLAEMGVLAPGGLRIPRREHVGPCALSFAQQRLWFLDQFEPHSCLYNIPYAVRLQGNLDVAALRRALTTIAERHEALRTTFVVRNDEPVQVVAERWVLDMPLADLSALPEATRAEELDRVLCAEARRPFDLSRDLMLRPRLVRLAADDHVLLLAMHHIASDGWSLGVLARELTHLYAAYREGRAPELPPLPIQYADYALWQRGELDGETLRTQLAYWKARLEGMPPTLQLPADRPRPAVQTYRGARETAVLPRTLVDALRVLSRRQRVTLFMTLLAAFQTLLHRYAGTDDVVVGTAIAGRRRAELEGLIGFFVNTLVMRTDLSGDPAFLDLLAHVRETVLAAFDHQDLPFEKLVEELHPARSLSWAPLVQVLFVLQNTDSPPPALPGCTVTPVPVDTDTAKFDLLASLSENESGLHVTLTYSTDLYDAGTIRRMLDHYATLLRGIAANPEERVSRLPLLTEAERRQVLVGWNATRTAPAAARCIHELFEAQAGRSPDAVAVAFEGRSLTYRQLNEGANQLAHRLRKHGVGPDVLVGLCLERSLEMVVGLFGILKAGGAYVPLDPTYPPERLAFILQDARISVVVTLQRFAHLLPPGAATVVRLDADRTTIAQEPQHDPVSGARADDLFYVVFTSGSTGTPKGVMIPHRAVLNFISWMQAAFPINGKDVVFQKTPFTFDISVWELCAPLLVGAALVMARPEGHRECRYLVETMRAAGVTQLHVVPTLMHALVNEPGLDACTSLRRIFSAGEALSGGLVEQVRAQLDVELVNLYGPTEGNVDTFWVAGPHAPADLAPIGRPIDNTQVYVLDAHLQPVPIGVPGNVYVGGAGVARGYVGKAELTAERFLPDPFGSEPGARLYATGDRGRYRPDGNLEFLGRLDHQVKLRGFRIELGEIEATLRNHPDVRDAVAALRGDPPHSQRLVAYLVPRAGTAPAPETLRRFLQKVLPEYMVPSAFVFLPALPLTPSGKVDRRNLPSPDTARPDRTIAPRDPMERDLVQIWEELLGVRPVGVTDNFFELGGHSLLAGRLVSRVREQFRVEVSLRALFEAPTVAGLATTIVQCLAAGTDEDAVKSALAELQKLPDEAAAMLLRDAKD